jgi:cytochrome c-type biogenesis protein CcmH
MLWAIFAILCILVVVLLAIPVLKGGADAPARVDYDIVVYRSQLTEIEQEIERGLLTAEQADAARAEIYRRMLAAEDAELERPHRFRLGGGKTARIVAIVAIGLCVPGGAALVYHSLGSPDLPGKPYFWRIHNDPDFVVASSADQLAKILEASPSASGYQQLGRMEFSARQYEQAANAYRRAIELGANEAVTWSEFGEALVVSSDGVVVPEAMKAFTHAVALEPRSERSRFYLGLSEAQIGNVREAVAIWRDLERTSEPDAPWLPMLREHIKAYAKQAGFDPASVPPAPPDLKAIDTALNAMTKAMHMSAGMNPAGATTPGATTPPAGVTPPPTGSDRETMVRSMVQKLADRMEKSPNDVSGWQRLAHVYIVMGQLDKARAAADHAVRLKPNDAGVQLSLAEVQKASAPAGDETPADFIATMRKVLALDGTNVEALYYVGLAERKAGHTARARELWTKAAGRAAPDDALAVEIHNQLGALPGG